MQYQAIAVVSNKTTQEAVRPSARADHYAIERALEEVPGIAGSIAWMRRRNLIRAEQLYPIPSGITTTAAIITPS